MSCLYIDASAISRIVLAQPGQRAPVRASAMVVSSSIVDVETHRAIDRLFVMGGLSVTEAAAKIRELKEFLGRVHLLAVTDDVIARARASFPVCVRALDAIHVASAELVGAQAGTIEFWTHDQRQAEAALLRGLSVKGV